MQPQHEVLFVEGLQMQTAQGSLAQHQHYKALCAAVGSKFTFSGCVPPSSTVSLKSCKSFAAEIKKKEHWSCCWPNEHWGFRGCLWVTERKKAQQSQGRRSAHTEMEVVTSSPRVAEVSVKLKPTVWSVCVCMYALQQAAKCGSRCNFC